MMDPHRFFVSPCVEYGRRPWVSLAAGACWRRRAPIIDLPDEIVLKLLSYLRDDPLTLIRLERVSRQFLRVIRSPSIRSELYLTESVLKYQQNKEELFSHRFYNIMFNTHCASAPRISVVNRYVLRSANYVKSAVVDLRFLTASYSTFHHLSMCANLTTLHIDVPPTISCGDQVNPVNPSGVWNGVSCLSPRLVTFSISVRRCSDQFVHDLFVIVLPHFTRLRSLRLDGTQYPAARIDRSAFVALMEALSHNLERLCILGFAVDWDAFLDGVGLLGSLRTLVAHIGVSLKLENAQFILKKCPALETFAFCGLLLTNEDLSRLLKGVMVQKKGVKRVVRAIAFLYAVHLTPDGILAACYEHQRTRTLEGEGSSRTGTGPLELNVIRNNQVFDEELFGGLGHNTGVSVRLHGRQDVCNLVTRGATYGPVWKRLFTQ